MKKSITQSLVKANNLQIIMMIIIIMMITQILKINYSSLDP